MNFIERAAKQNGSLNDCLKTAENDQSWMRRFTAAGSFLSSFLSGA